MKKRILLLLILLWAVIPMLATEIIPLDLFKPFRIRTDGTRIFIGQGAEIYVYSADDYKLITKFGKAGSGPQEFKLFPEFSADFDVQTDTLVAYSLGKVSLFTKEGKFLEEKKLAGGGNHQFYRKWGNQLVGERFSRGKDGIIYKVVAFFDGQLNKVKEIFRYKNHAQSGKQFIPISRGLYTPNFYIYDQRIFIGGEIYADTIHVFDISGKALYTIAPPVDKVKFTEADRQGHIDTFALYRDQYERLKKFFKYPDYFPLWQNFVVTGDRIYIQTFKRNRENTKNEIVILSLKGELIGKVWLPFDEYHDFTPCPYTIHGKKQYQCVDNEDEGVWELHITGIE